ncbi:hypothetical protein KAS45_03905 [candidate division WOR-3 bacterium]|nr:hypothetical protein [candidate division WOR-3 bacterium]
MRRLLFLLLTLAVVPLFASNGNFVYYTYGYYDNCNYDEYWYDNYWYDGYWVSAPYGYYCGYFSWWYPWWWDWYWWRSHWCHHWSWDFFYSGFYVVWYDYGSWWYRPRYGNYVRYRLPCNYYTLRTRARTHGIYLPEKPPRAVNVPYRENQIRELTRQNDPELFARVEKEHRSGNLEKMRNQYAAKVNREIAHKNNEYGIRNRNIDINEIAKSGRSVSLAQSKGSARIQKQSKQISSNVRQEQTSKKATSRIQKKSKSETRVSGESHVRSDKRTQQTRKKQVQQRSPQVERTKDTDRKGKESPERTKVKSQKREAKVQKPAQKERKGPPRPEKRSGSRPSESRAPRHYGPQSGRNKR